MGVRGAWYLECVVGHGHTVATAATLELWYSMELWYMWDQDSRSTIPTVVVWYPLHSGGMWHMGRLSHRHGSCHTGGGTQWSCGRVGLYSGRTASAMMLTVGRLCSGTVAGSPGAGGGGGGGGYKTVVTLSRRLSYWWPWGSGKQWYVGAGQLSHWVELW